MTRLFVVAGLPGAGKTTLARRLAVAHVAVHLGCDDWLGALDLDLLDARLRRRAERRLWAHAQELLARGVSVVVDFGSWSRLERDRFRRTARRLGVDVELHALDVPTDERWRRVQRRSVEAGLADAVPSRAQLASLEDYWQAADDDERAAYDAPLPLVAADW